MVKRQSYCGVCQSEQDTLDGGRARAARRPPANATSALTECRYNQWCGRRSDSRLAGVEGAFV